MTELFSDELKVLIAKSRNVAIELGYDYISSIHFFIADCEMRLPSTLLNFAFTNESEYLKFKMSYNLDNEDLLNNFDENLPLTKEAESIIRLLATEPILSKQTLIYPCHFFIAALKDKKSLFAECFKSEENVLDKLIKYYLTSGAFEVSKMTDTEINSQYYIPGNNMNHSILKVLKNLFKFRK